jgi:drug/metabolite transporter (DMT)-like permease
MSGDLPSMQKSFFRNIIALIFALFFIFKNKVPLKIKSGNLKYMILRATFGTIAIWCNFYAVDHLVLADASMLQKMSPFCVVVFSYLVLKEKISFIQLLSIIIAFIGSMFVVKPTFVNMDLIPSLIGFMGGVMAGAAYTCIRAMGTRGENGTLIVCFFSAFSSLVVLPFFIIGYHPMSLNQLFLLVLGGVFATIGQVTITAAYTYAPASEISIYDYSQILYSAIIGYIIFNQVSDIYSWIGYCIICTMAIVMFLYNNRKT